MSYQLGSIILEQPVFLENISLVPATVKFNLLFLTKLRQRQGGIRNPPLTPRISFYKGNVDLAMPVPMIRGLFQMSGVI
jgi:hypothetical protein